MTKREKRRQKIEQNPKNVRFNDLQRLLEDYGFTLKRSKGSHHSFVVTIGNKKKLLVVPKKNPLNPVYVKEALAIIKQIEEGETNGE
jgi:predicted RNA binding protein YcfA (HicA-like mRNA interferase family)